jgi:hypothetical protein
MERTNQVARTRSKMIPTSFRPHRRRLKGALSEGSYPTGNASPNKTKSPVDNMKEYISRKPLVESSMVKEATETTEKRADIFIRHLYRPPIKRTVGTTCF